MSTTGKDLGTWLAAAALAVSAAGAHAAPKETHPMKAGFCATDITPAIGMEQPGGYGKAYIRAIHDPLKVRAAVLEQGDTTLALVGIDTCLLPPAGFTAAVRSEIQKQCGIPAGNILLAASHTHSGGPLTAVSAALPGAPELVRRLAEEYSTCPDPDYVAWATRQAVTAVCEAFRRRQEARISIGSGREEQVGFNRRQRMANGRSYSHAGKGNPDIIGYAGPTDPEVGVVAAWTPDGKLLGCIVNFACHGTTFGGAVSADWICYLEQTIQGALGRDAGVVFLNGACGDVTQVDNLSARESEFGERWARFVGARVGAEAVKVMVSSEPGEPEPLAAASKTLRIARRAQSPARLDESRRIVEEGLRTGNRDTAWTFAKERLILEWLARAAPEVDVELQALQIGGALFLTCPAELFCALGLEIKAGSPFERTYVVELANGCVGYVPTEEAFSPAGGGYETVLTSYSNLDVRAGSRIVAGCLELARGLKPGTLPGALGSRPAAPKGAPWSYGVLGPELD